MAMGSYNYAYMTWRKLNRFEVVNNYPWALHSKGSQAILATELAPSQSPSHGLPSQLKSIPLSRVWRWPPVLWKSLAQGLQLWGHQPGWSWVNFKKNFQVYSGL